MSTTLVIEPPQNLIESVVSLIDTGKTDLSEVAIVFPGKRPAHFVRKALGGRIKQSFIPPNIFSIDEFIERFYSGLESKPSKNLDAVDAVALLFQVHSAMKERLGDTSFATLDAFYPIGQKLFGELEELRIANLSTKQIDEALEGLTYGRLNSLSEYYHEFYALATQNGYVTRSMRYSLVAERCVEIDLSPFASVIITGFLALTKSEQQLFGELRRRNNVTFVYQQGHGLREHFKQLKIDGPAEDQKESTEPDISFYEAQDTHGQVFTLSSLIKELIGRGAAIDEKTVVVLPTADALFPLYHHTLPLLKQDQYNIALGYPLSRTPIYGFVNNLMDLVSAKQADRYPASAYLTFVLHPYTKNLRFENRSDITRVLFHALEEYIAGDKSRMFVTLEELESMDELFTSLPFAIPDDAVTPEQLKAHLKSIHDKTIRAFDAFQSIGDCAKKAIGVLLVVYEQSTASLHPMFRAYAETILEMFHDIELSLLSSHRFEKPEAYFNFLRRFVATQEVPFAGTPLQGMQVLGLLETRNLQFDDVFVLDANDDVIPGALGQEMMLPQGLREKLGLETYRNREQLTEYYFGLLLQGAKRVHLFFTETGKSEKSRFVEKLLWNKQQRDGLRAAEEATSVVRYKVRLSNPLPSPIAKTPEVVKFLMNFSYSASALDTYLRCPLRFYYSKVAGLVEKEEADADVDAQEVGVFVHAVLKKYFEALVGRNLTVKDLNIDRLESLVSDLFTVHFGTDNIGTLFLMKRQIAKQLKSFLVNYQTPLVERNSVLIEDLEQKIQIEKFGFRIEGRLDRIEHRGGEIFILDYKTGKDNKHTKINFKKLVVEDRETWGEAISSLQLPFYLLLYSEKNKTPIEQIRPAYLFLGRNVLDKNIEMEFEQNPDARIEQYQTSIQVIQRILNEIVSGGTPFAPTSDLQKNCPECPYRVLCGTQWVKGWNGG